MSVTQAQMAQISLAAYQNRHTFAHKITRRLPGRAFKYGVVYSAGQALDPERVTTGNYLAGIKVHVKGTVTYTQAATTAAPTMTDTGHLALINNLAIIGENQVTPVSLSGIAAENFRLLEQRADYVSTAVFGLPAANATTGTVTATETVDFWTEFDNVQDMVDLLGIQNINNDQLNVNVQINCGNFTDAVNLPSGVTAAPSLTMDLYAIRFRANKQNQPGPDFTKFFNQLAVVRNQAMNSEDNVVNINYKNVITRLLVHCFTAPNVLDHNNSLGVTRIRLTASSDTIVIRDQDISEIIDEQAKRYGQQFYTLYGQKGVYVIEMDMLRDYVDANKYTDLKLTITTGATPAAGASVSVYLQGLTNTDPNLQMFY